MNKQARYFLFLSIVGILWRIHCGRITPWECKLAFFFTNLVSPRRNKRFFSSVQPLEVNLKSYPSILKVGLFEWWVWKEVSAGWLPQRQILTGPLHGNAKPHGALELVFVWKWRSSWGLTVRSGPIPWVRVWVGGGEFQTLWRDRDFNFVGYKIHERIWRHSF